MLGVECCWYAQNHTRSIVMGKSLKAEFIAHEKLLTHTSSVRGRNVAAGRSRSVSHTSNVMGKECCWEAQIRDTQAAMLKWGRNVAGRLRLETRR